MRRLFSMGTLFAAGLLVIGVLVWQGGSALADRDAATRGEDAPDVVLVDDDDDDDTDVNTDTADTADTAGTGTGTDTDTGTDTGTGDRSRSELR